MRRPIVTTVIPTRNRTELLRRAVQSALNQTFGDLEVLIVVDGPDDTTVESLNDTGDDRVRVIALSQNVGGAEARNIGTRSAHARWIAFLDDDDEWLPDKIEKQLAATRGLQGELVFVASRFIERTAARDRVLPTRSLNYTGPFSDFLFCREHLTGGTGYVQTSTWLVSKALLERVPFTSGLKRNQDIDWMVRAAYQPGCIIRILPEPLAIFHEDYRPGRVSKQPDWQFHYDWALANRSYLTARAFSFCIATLCVPEAARQQMPFRTYLKLLYTCCADGRMTPTCLVFFLYYWLVSDRLREYPRALMAQDGGRFNRRSKADQGNS